MKRTVSDMMPSTSKGEESTDCVGDSPALIPDDHGLVLQFLWRLSASRMSCPAAGKDYYSPNPFHATVDGLRWSFGTGSRKLCQCGFMVGRFRSMTMLPGLKVRDMLTCPGSSQGWKAEGLDLIHPYKMGRGLRHVGSSTLEEQGRGGRSFGAGFL
jgi:hypothetical protein